MVEMISEPSVKPGVPARKGKAKARLLLVDDNRRLSSLLKARLEKLGYDVACARDGEEGLAAIRKRAPDLVLLDVVMPKVDGIELLKTVRQESRVPVLMLTGQRGELDQLLGFKMGADDYVVKPFCFEVLAARVESLLKRSAVPAGDKSVLRVGGIAIDPEKRELRVEGMAIDLTIKEFDLLKALIEARGKVLTRDHLLNAVWGVDEDCDIRTRTVDQHIAGIRHKLGPEGKRVVTVTHFGYRIKMD